MAIPYGRSADMLGNRAWILRRARISLLSIMFTVGLAILVVGFLSHRYRARIEWWRMPDGQVGRSLLTLRISGGAVSIQSVRLFGVNSLVQDRRLTFEFDRMAKGDDPLPAGGTLIDRLVKIDSYSTNTVEGRGLRLRLLLPAVSLLAWPMVAAFRLLLRRNVRKDAVVGVPQ